MLLALQRDNPLVLSWLNCQVSSFSANLCETQQSIQIYKFTMKCMSLSLFRFILFCIFRPLPSTHYAVFLFAVPFLNFLTTAMPVLSDILIYVCICIWLSTFRSSLNITLSIIYCTFMSVDIQISPPQFTIDIIRAASVLNSFCTRSHE